MKNITGNPVTHKDYLKTRLFLVKELRELLEDCSVIIEAPRRFGKTSVIKEFMRRQNAKDDGKRQFNILFFELEGEKNVNDFCLKLFRELLTLYQVRKKIDILSNILGDFWNSFAGRFKKIKVPGFELELQAKTRNYSFSEWKGKITPMIEHLNAFDKRTVMVFDEFPDMLMNFKRQGGEGVDFKATTDDLLAWFRSLRQVGDKNSKYRFVFCGSINLRKTLEDIGLSKRINDLEPFVIPPINSEDAGLLLELLAKKYRLEIEPDGIEFMISKIEYGSLYYGQILIQALRDAKETQFSLESLKAIYGAMLRRGNHDLNHWHSRFEDYLSPTEIECSTIILKRLCLEAIHEKEVFDLLLYEKFPYDLFQSVVNRLIYEGYIVRDMADNGNLRFMAPLLKDWWGCKVGVKDVRL